MPTLEECKTKVGELVLAKGFGNSPADFPLKLFFAFIELGEAGDNWKKGPKKFESEQAFKEATAEEIIDVIFYALDAARVRFPEIDMDAAFEKKWAKNMNRPFKYGEGFTERGDKVSQ